MLNPLLFTRAFRLHSSSSSQNPFISTINEIVQQHPVVVFSKGSCPYCFRVARLFEDLQVDVFNVDLEQNANASQFQDALHEITGIRTVPNVFIGAESIQGADNTLDLHQTGKLIPLIEQAQKKLSPDKT